VVEKPVVPVESVPVEPVLLVPVAVVPVLVEVAVVVVLDEVDDEGSRFLLVKQPNIERAARTLMTRRFWFMSSLLVQQSSLCQSRPLRMRRYNRRPFQECRHAPSARRTACARRRAR
jgi:hypothetical protein